MHPLLTYAIQVWYPAASAFTKNIIFVLQKRALRTLTCAEWLAPTRPLFLGLEILPLDQLYVYCYVCFMDDYRGSLTFSKRFIRAVTIYGKETRFNHNFRLPQIRKSKTEAMFSYQGVLMLQYIEGNLLVHSHTCYRKALRACLLKSI